MRTQDKWMNLEKPNDDDGLLLSGKRDIAAIHGSIEEISKYFPFLKLFFSVSGSCLSSSFPQRRSLNSQQIW